ncbi:MAG: homoserine dehydrogenase, partial [Firmicutes bacterium]|nr:homoserine dehydrogenase [Bacillota bacterium]
MKTIKVALIGFGNVAQSFTRLLLEKEQEIKAKYDTAVSIVAIATKTRGIVVDAWGIDAERALGIIESNE